MSDSPFKNKKIAIIGCSVEGLASVDFLIKQKAYLTLCDQKKEEEFKPELLKKFKQNKIKLQFGQNYLDHLEDFDLIVRTPGFPLWHSKLQKLSKKVIVTSQTKLFFDLCPAKIIGVTGTKGKGTTATLIYQLLKKAGYQVFLGGNIGNPPFSFLEKLNNKSWVVLELSSFQLEDLKKSPHIAVVLNIASDHLYSASLESPNYHQSWQDYIKAKSNLVRFQTKNDFAVLNRDYKNSFDLRKLTKAEVWFFSTKKK